MRTSIWAELEVTLDVVLDDSADVGEDVRGIRIGAKSGVMVTRWSDPNRRGPCNIGGGATANNLRF